MSFLNIGEDLRNTFDEHPVEAGEYKLRIVRASIYEDRALMVRFEVVDDPYAKEIMDFMNLPGTGDMTPKQENWAKKRINHFVTAFSIDPDLDITPDDVGTDYPIGIVGLEGWALLGPPTDDGKGFGPQNRIQKYVGAA